MKWFIAFRQNGETKIAECVSRESLRMLIAHIADTGGEILCVWTEGSVTKETIEVSDE